MNDGRRKMIEHLLLTYLEKKTLEYAYISKNIEKIKVKDLELIVDMLASGNEIQFILDTLDI